MNPPEWKIAVVGAGNLAWSLIPNLQEAGFMVSQLISRDQEKVGRYCRTYQIKTGSTRLEKLRSEINLVFLTVSDQAIQSLAEQLSTIVSPETIVVHTSGSVALSALNALGGQKGVFYPLQIFTQSRVTKMKEVPLFLEGNEDVIECLLPLAKALSQKVHSLNSQDRLRLHLGAVLACNFPNYLYRMTAQVNPKLDFDVYGPLIRETIDKVLAFHPDNTQTGPAIRGDESVLSQHLELLNDKPEWQELYQMISKLINPDLGEGWK